MICCGGRTGPGGMSRMVDYYMAEWEAQGRAPQLMLIDSTGPSYFPRKNLSRKKGAAMVLLEYKSEISTFCHGMVRSNSPV